MYFIRLLAGTLFESWKTLGKNQRFRGVRERVKEHLDDPALAAMNWIQGYFSKESLCEKIRNNYTHHNNFGSIREIIRQWPHTENLEIVLAEHHGNCRYIASDVIINYSFFCIEDPQDGASKFLNEIREVVGAFVEYFSACLSVLLNRVIHEEGIPKTEESIPGVPSIHECRLHYFMRD